MTEDLEFPADKLWVTIYTDDDEAFDIWTKNIGLDPSGSSVSMIIFGRLVRDHAAPVQKSIMIAAKNMAAVVRLVL